MNNSKNGLVHFGANSRLDEQNAINVLDTLQVQSRLDELNIKMGKKYALALGFYGQQEPRRYCLFCNAPIFAYERYLTSSGRLAHRENRIDKVYCSDECRQKAYSKRIKK